MTMVIQSVTKNKFSTQAVVLDVAPGSTDETVMRFLNMSPRGYEGDHSVRILDDFSGEVTRKSAVVTYFTD
jgi:hypothetical protein